MKKHKITSEFSKIFENKEATMQTVYGIFTLEQTGTVYKHDQFVLAVPRLFKNVADTIEVLLSLGKRQATPYAITNERWEDLHERTATLNSLLTPDMQKMNMVSYCTFTYQTNHYDIVAGGDIFDQFYPPNPTYFEWTLYIGELKIQ